MSVRNDILAALASTEVVPRERVLEWIAAGDLESWALLYELTGQAYSRIDPELGMEETCGFLLEYYLACIAGNTERGPNGHSRFEAASEMAGWLDKLWDRRPDTDSVIEELVHRMTELFLRSDPVVRNCLETGFLEHVFERKELVTLFEAWQSHPELSTAYSDCVEWGVAHRRE